jgi:hypothetical protein
MTCTCMFSVIDPWCPRHSDEFKVSLSQLLTQEPEQRRIGKTITVKFPPRWIVRDWPKE